MNLLWPFFVFLCGINLALATSEEASRVETNISQMQESSHRPSHQGFCENSLTVNGLSAPCSEPCKVFNLRIEGSNTTIYEGPVRAGPKVISTSRGGTHACTGTNLNANRRPGGTSTTGLDAASLLCGFTYDGTWSSQFDDFYIEKIGSPDSVDGGGRYWGLLNNFNITDVGGCQEEPASGDEVLWAFDAFHARYFLDVKPREVRMKVGSSKMFAVKGHDGSGTKVAVSNASFGGGVSGEDGRVVFEAVKPGVYRLKATQSGSIRSPAVIVTVDP